MYKLQELFEVSKKSKLRNSGSNKMTNKIPILNFYNMLVTTYSFEQF